MEGHSIVKKLLRARFFLGLFVVGIVFVIGGIMFMNRKQTTGTETTATITQIKEDYDSATEGYIYTVYVEYTDSEGTKHTAITDGYTSSMKEGSTITVKYDLSNPDVVSVNSMNFIPFVLLGLGALLIIVSIAKIIMTIKKPLEEENDLNKVKMNSVSQETIESIKNNDEDIQNYNFFMTTGARPNYVLETPEHKIIYEAISLKLGLVTKYQYQFVNHLTGSEDVKEIGHTITSEMGEGTLEFITDAHFSINGIRCWDTLGALGYALEPHLEGLGYTFDVSKYGVNVAKITSAGTNLATSKNYKLGNIPTLGYFKIECKESDIEGIFLACFILSRI